MRKKLIILIFFMLLTAVSGYVWNQPGILLHKEQVLDHKVEGFPSSSTFNFVVFGDSKILPDQPGWKGNVVLSQIIDSVNRDSPAFVVYLGDGVDKGGPISNLLAFRSALEKLKMPWYPVIGNHEVLRGAGTERQGDGEQNYIEVFADKLTQEDARGRKVSYYSFDYLDSHFIVMDTAWQGKKDDSGIGLFPGSLQWQWLEQDLEKARPKSKHIFILGHKPPLTRYKPVLPIISKSQGDSKETGYDSSWGNREAVESFIGLCRRYSVDAVFSGHIHIYDSFKDGGTTHIISGGAGAGLYAPPDQGGYFHYVVCRVNQDGVSYDVVRL